MPASKSSRTRKPVTRVHASPTAPTQPASAARPASTARGNGAGSSGTARGAAAGRSPAPAADEPRKTQLAPPWLQWTTFVLAIAGLGVSAYLTAEHFQGGQVLGCAENSAINCTKVTTSSQSWVWVIPHHWAIPVSVLGLAFFLFAMVPLMSPAAWRATDHISIPSALVLGRQRLRRSIPVPPTLIPRLRLGSLALGIVFVLYLVYAELFWIKSICLYCTSVHIITFLLLAFTAIAAALWGLNPMRQAD